VIVDILAQPAEVPFCQGGHSCYVSELKMGDDKILTGSLRTCQEFCLRKGWLEDPCGAPTLQWVSWGTGSYDESVFYLSNTRTRRQ